MVSVRNQRARKGFTLVELVISVGILALLITILVPVVNNARIAAAKVASQAQLNNISTAITQYHQTFKAYPGYFADDKYNSTELTSTENLVLSLAGGDQKESRISRRANGPPSILLNNGDTYAVDLDAIGKGPFNAISGRSYGAFYAYQPDEIGTVTVTADPKDDNNNMPELLDKITGLPILYYRFRRGGTTPVGDKFLPTPTYRVAAEANDHYLAEYLTTAQNDVYPQDQFSLIHPSNNRRNENLARILRNKKLSQPLKTHLTPDGVGDPDPNDGDGDVISGGYALIAPGPDGIYFNEGHNFYHVPSEDSKVYNEQDTFDDTVLIGGTD